MSSGDDLLYLDDAASKLHERVFVFPAFAGIGPGATSPLNTVPIVADTDEYMRLLAIRGGLKNSNILPLTGLELGQLELQLAINGAEELTELSQFSPFDGLFTKHAPWLYFACPPRICHREAVHAFVRNRASVATLTPYLQLKVVDEGEWLAQMASEGGA